jgi:hypothetical protein
MQHILEVYTLHTCYETTSVPPHPPNSLFSPKIYLKDNSIQEVIGRGKIMVSLKVGKRKALALFFNVLYAPLSNKTCFHESHN